METQQLIIFITDYITYTPWWIIFLQLFFVWIVYLAFKGIYLLTIIRLSGRHHKPKSYVREGNNKILIVGDSTAAGTGSGDIERTLGGYLARDFPKTDIINKSVNGSLTGQVVDQLVSVASEKFDMILISTGGNDVWTFTRSKKIKIQLTAAIDLAKMMSNHRVVLVFFGNEGSAPFFPLFMSGLLLKQTERVRQIFNEVANHEKVPFIELFSKPEGNPFIKEPGHFFAPDGLHPNEFGYWEWYKHLWKLMISENYFFQEEIILKSQQQTVE